MMLIQPWHMPKKILMLLIVDTKIKKISFQKLPSTLKEQELKRL